MHLGACSREKLAAWAVEQGASPGAARTFARVFVGRFAGRDAGSSLDCARDERPAKPGPISRKLLARAEATFTTALPGFEAVPVIDRTDRTDPTDRSDRTSATRYALRLADAEVVEAVAIPHPARTTVCLSTQVGCARGCVFCETGRLGLRRQLAVEEITGQLAVVARYLRARGWPAPTNVVFMGMGEPLDNLDAVLQAIEVLTDDAGFAIAPRRVTVSTVGIVPKMRELYGRSKARLAVSLHATTDEERQRLVPHARWSVAELREAIGESPRTVLVQWTLIAGRNDTGRHADDLARFCEGLDVRVNLIPLNPGPADRLRAPSWERVRAFQKRLLDRGVRTLVRMPHGQEIGGACGQLAGGQRMNGG